MGVVSPSTFLPATLVTMGPKSNLPIEREGIIDDNPEKFYTFGDEIGTGKFAVTRHVTHKISGDKYAAKVIKYDSDSLKFAIREYDFMKEFDMSHPGLCPLHEAYICRKYMILILEVADGLTLGLCWKETHLERRRCSRIHKTALRNSGSYAREERPALGLATNQHSIQLTESAQAGGLQLLPYHCKQESRSCC